MRAQEIWPVSDCPGENVNQKNNIYRLDMEIVGTVSK